MCKIYNMRVMLKIQNRKYKQLMVEITFAFLLGFFLDMLLDEQTFKKTSMENNKATVVTI